MQESEKPHLWGRYHYTAFVSYSRADKRIGARFQKAIERFQIPKPLIDRRTANGPVPRNLIPVFRDITDSSATGDLGSRIQTALADSAFLIVLCSPHSAASHWVNVEIESFKRLGGARRIIAILVDGEPVEHHPEHAPHGAFPPALMRAAGPDGALTDEREPDPIAPDLRPQAEGFQYAVLKTVAAMIDLAPDILSQRQAEMERARQRAVRRVALAMMGLAALATLSTFAAFNQLVAARKSQSATYAGMAWSAIGKGEYDRGARLALQGLPAGEGLVLKPGAHDAEDAMEAALWNNRTQLRFNGHRAEREMITAINVSADGRTAASVGLTGWLRVWSLETGEEKFVLPWAARWMESFIHASYSARLSPDGKRVVTFGVPDAPENGMTACGVDLYNTDALDEKWRRALGIIYDVETGCPAVAIGASPSDYNPMSGFLWSPDGATILAFNWGVRHIGAFDAATGAQLYEFDTNPDEPSHWGEDFAEGVFAPEPVFTSDGSGFVAQRSNSEFALIDAKTGETKRSIIWPADDYGVRGIALSADDSRLAVAGINGRVALYDLANGEAIWSRDINVNEDDPLLDFAISPDGRKIAVISMNFSNRNSRLDVYDADQNMVIWTADNVEHAAFSGDGSALATFAKGRGEARNPESGDVIERLYGHEAPISELVAAPGSYVLSGDDKGEIRRWDLQRRVARRFAGDIGQIAHARPAGLMAALARDGADFLLMSEDGNLLYKRVLEKPAAEIAVDETGTRVAIRYADNSLEVADARDGEIAWRGEAQALAQNALSADGKRVAFLRADGSVVIAEVDTATIAEIPKTERAWRQAALSADGAVVFAAASDRLAAYSAADASLLWTYRGHKQRIDRPEDETFLQLKRFVISRTGMRALVIEDNSPNGEFMVDHATLLDGATGKIISILPFDAYESVFGAAFSDDGDSLVTAAYAESGDSPDARLWNAATGALRASVDLGEQRSISSLSIASDHRFVTSDNHATMEIWSMTSGRRIGALTTPRVASGYGERTHALIAGETRAFILRENGDLEFALLPPHRSGAALAERACAAAAAMGIEQLSLNERADAGVSDANAYPCRKKGALSPDFYVDAARMFLNQRPR